MNVKRDADGNWTFNKPLLFGTGNKTAFKVLRPLPMRKGFAAMKPKKARQIQRQGGKARQSG